jgi:hypothetical protein
VVWGKLTDAFGNPVSEERNLGTTPMQVLRQFNPATGLTELIRAGTAANPALAAKEPCMAIRSTRHGQA